MRRARGKLLLALGAVLLALLILPGSRADKQKAKTPAELVGTAVGELVKIQEEGGQWPYEGVYRVGGQLPIGYRIGGTSLAAITLMHAAPDNADAQTAVGKALAFVLKELNDPLMAPSTEDRYDVRVWGHACALEFLCYLRAHKLAGDQGKEVERWIATLVETLLKEEIPGGGWNYASRQRQAAFVTAPVTQALLLAHGQGEKVPDEVFQRARKALEESRAPSGAFVYSGSAKSSSADTRLPGSAAWSAVCETTLVLLGGGSVDAIQAGVEAFFKHWDELEKRRKKPGTHVGEYSIAPYYFYYGHRYAAQAVAMLPAEARPKERERLLETILKTRDADGTWNDRVFPRTRNYGTSMIVLALLGDKTPLPPRYQKK